MMSLDLTAVTYFNFFITLTFYHHRDLPDCREQIASNDPELAHLMEAGPLSAPYTLEAAICDQDPLPYGRSAKLSF